MAEDVTVRRATEADLDAINRIYNDEVLTNVASWDFEAWSIEQRREWFAEHEGDETTPVFVAELASEPGGEVAGMSYLSQYRPRPGYRYTRENTVYVDPRFHRRGIGAQLLGALVEEARRVGLRTVVAVIEGSNDASVALHEQFGYERVGLLHDAGYKFGRWLDSIYMELRLPGPEGGGDGAGDGG
ncbi:MAG: N-acetyltransferase family protein [Dehalococcoidia bacterium]